MLMKGYTGNFVKKDGSKRTMRFVRLDDLPTGTLDSHIKGVVPKRKLAEGMELVWDLDSKGFRMFNWKTVDGEVSEIEVSNPFEEN